jgi:hypothetical protein
VVAPDLPVAPPRPPRAKRDPVVVQTVLIALVVLVGLVKISVATSHPDEVALRPALVGAASSTARKQQTARAELTLLGDGKQIERADFQIDFAHRLGLAEMEFGDAAVGAGLPRHLTLVGRDADAWVKVPDERLSLNAGKAWIAVTGAGPVGGVTPGITSDPTQLLDSVGAGEAEPVETGREDVRGVATVKYHLELSVEEVLAQMPDELRDQGARVFAAAGAGTLRYDVWLDHAGLPRRIRNDIDTNIGSMSVVVEMFDYGRPVDITVPSEAESRTVPTITDALRVVGLPGAGLMG